MFPSTKSRFRSAAIRGLDFAVEFATLGEYRLPEQHEAPARARASRPLRPPRPSISIARQATRLMPATAAARRSGAGSNVPLGADEALRTMALSGEGPIRSARPRVRAGQASPPPQPCLTAEAS